MVIRKIDCRETNKKSIVEILVQTLTLLKHVSSTTWFPVIMYEIVIFKASSESINDDLTLY